MKENMSKSQFPEVPANKWPPQKETLLRKHYSTMPWPDLVKLIGKSKAAIYDKASRLGLVRTAGFVRHEGQNFTIGKPHVVAHKRQVPPIVREAPVRNSNAKGTYAGAELQPFSGRPGAMYAYALPSRTFDKREYRDGRVEAV